MTPTTFRSSCFERHNPITAAAVIINGDPNEAAAMDVLEKSVAKLNDAKGIGEAFKTIGEGLEQIEALAPKSFKDLPANNEASPTMDELMKQVHGHFPDINHLVNFCRWTVETAVVGMLSHPYSENGIVTGMLVHYAPEVLAHLALTDAELKLPAEERQAALADALRRAARHGTRFVTPKAGRLAGKIAVIYTLDQTRDLANIWCRDEATLDRFEGVAAIEVIEVTSDGIIRGSVPKLGG